MVKKLDCRGMQCPQPVIQVKDALDETNEEEITVLVDNEAACANVTQFAVNQGHNVSHIEEEGEFDVRIIKRQKESINASLTRHNALREQRGSSKMVIYIDSETMGSGDDGLGRILMSAFIDTLSHFAKQISHIILINAAVKFACQGSASAKQLLDLEGTGIEIHACGTCLSHFGLTDRLSAGKNSNMYSILHIFSKAEKIVKP